MNLNIFEHPRKVFIILFSCFLLYSFWVYSIPLFSTYPTPIPKTKLVSDGRLVWQKYNCHTCHQFYGLGGYLGPDLTNVYSRSNKNEAYIKAMIQSGVRQMPAFDLSEDEMTTLLAFLKDVDASGNADVKAHKPEILGTFSLEKK